MEEGYPGRKHEEEEYSLFSRTKKECVNLNLGVGTESNFLIVFGFRY